jgi:hypothetical protein
LDLAALLMAATLIGIVLVRASSFSNALAIPGALAFLPAAAAAIMRRSSNLPLRVMPGAGASLLALPLTIISPRPRRFAPRGFAARLTAGTIPNWLHPVALPGLSGKLYAITR